MADELHTRNLRLSQIEYQLQHIYLRSQPRCLGLVLGNGCNIDCVHCYQPKNADNLLRPAAIGQELRREFIGLYPYLSTLRVQGGEVFAYGGFRDLLDDVESTVDRPLVSVSTNATLIDDAWAERIVRMPFSNLTISIDGGTPGTFARLRSGSRLDAVLANVGRIRKWKEKLGSPRPVLDSFFVVMRSNFREIPEYLRLMREHGIDDVSLQTLEITPENAARTPGLERDEAIRDPAEIRELHRILAESLPRERPHFRMIRACGLQSIFEQQSLGAGFLMEDRNGLYPNSDELAGDAPGFELCPNPWTTLFVIENGDVHLCFIAEPVGNLYESPLAEIWNSPRAVAKRSRMLAGRYVESGCSPQYCGWRDGRQPSSPPSTRELLVEIRRLQADAAPREAPDASSLNGLGAVRRMVSSRDQRIRELETLFQQVSDANAQFHELGQQHIDHLETRVAELTALHDRPLVRVANRLSRAWDKLTRHE